MHISISKSISVYIYIHKYIYMCVSICGSERAWGGLGPVWPLAGGGRPFGEGIPSGQGVSGVHLKRDGDFIQKFWRVHIWLVVQILVPFWVP